MGVTNTSQELIIEPVQGWRLIDLKELWRYKDLFWFLVWRDVKTRYAQSVLGMGWAVLQPLFSMVVFTIIFGKLAKVSSDGVPYAIFSYTALVPWTYFSGALGGASGSLASGSSMINKVYFPRLVIPLAPVLSKLVDFLVALVLVGILMVWYEILPNVWCLALPALVFLMSLTSAGLGMWMTALAARYRDVKYATGFLVQLLMYAAPVVYPASKIPEQYRLVYGLFPMAGVIEGFRSGLLGTRPMPWDLLAVGSVTAVVLFITGALYFRRMERHFADIV